MVTPILEQVVQDAVRARTLADYEVCKVPYNWLQEPLQRPKGKNRPVQRRLRVPVPDWAWQRIWDAVPVFGLQGIYVCAPHDAFLRVHYKRDPLVVGRAGNRWYFIAAWDLL